MTSSQLPCPTCHGAGELTITRHTYSTRELQWYPDEDTYTCPTCHGTGDHPDPVQTATLNVSYDLEVEPSA